MNEISILNGYKIKDKQAVRYYNTVADMVADTNLKTGMHVKTAGYYSMNDGGTAEYKIVNDNTLIEDKGQYHLLNNGLFAQLIVDTEVNPEQFGAKGDGTTDDTEALQNAIDYANENKIKIVCNKTYLITDTIILQDDINFELNGEIKITEDIIAIQVSTNYANLKIHKITGTGTGTGIKLIPTSVMVDHTNITIDCIRDLNVGILLYTARTGTGIQYNKFNIGHIYNITDSCIKFDHPNGGWINQNYFYNGKLDGGYGINMVGSSISYYHGNAFYNIGLENISIEGIHIEYAKFNKFYNIRNAEGLTGSYWINVDANSPHNKIEFTEGIKVAQINCIARTEITSHLVQPDGYTICDSFIVRNNQFDMNNNSYNTNNQIYPYNTDADLGNNATYKYFNINKIIKVAAETPNIIRTIKINDIIKSYGQFYLQAGYINEDQNAGVKFVDTDDSEIISSDLIHSNKMYLCKQLYSGTWKVYELG